MDNTEKLLKEITEAHGVPGAEIEIRALMRSYLEPYGNVTTDKLGSLICETSTAGPRVEIVAHMDEIGFMTRHITKDGFIKFIQLGGWWDQVLLGHRVIIKTRKNGDILGIIGAKPPHLVPRSERSKVVEKKNMYIDVGVSSSQEVEELGIRVGDYVVPDSDFQIMANGKTYVSKAFDDRVGCAVMVQTLEALRDNSPPNQVFAVASVQEEIGVRGATTSVYEVQPDLAIVLESGIAGDVPGINADQSSEKLGGGPVVGIYDAGMLVNTKLRDFVLDVAEAEDIDVQFAFIEAGANDGRAIQQFQGGVPTIALSVTARHIHSHNSIIHRDDFDDTVKLLTAILQRLDADAVADIQSFD